MAIVQSEINVKKKNKAALHLRAEGKCILQSGLTLGRQTCISL